MHKLCLAFLLILFTTLGVFGTTHVFATGSDVLIKRVQLGDSFGASNEYIEIYNNSDNTIDVTNWCLYYASAYNETNGSKMSCLLPDNPNIYIFLPSHVSMLAVSTHFFTTTTIPGDMKFSATLSDKSGHIRLIDDENNEIDKIGWGPAAISPEGSAPAQASTVGNVMSRKQISETFLQDTDVNSEDFEVIPSVNVFIYGQIYEVQDLCSNIDQIQTALPDGYSVDTNSICSPAPIDVCGNIDGFQADLPIGYGFSDENRCEVDVCINLDNLQTVIPDGYLSGDEKICKLILPAIKLSELLPNPVGVDDGSEFIEIYNPNDIDIDLKNYSIMIGTGPVQLEFPVDSFVAANSYKSFSNSEMNFTLVNTSGSVKILTIDDELMDESAVYENPDEGDSWAIINGIWQYTNNITPGFENIAFKALENIEVSVDDSLMPCAANQYRSPETNRCRLISTVNSILAPCAEGQYRSETTNRCRSIASDVIGLVPCAEGQERNPDTNRCRSINGSVLGVGELKPCKVGQERNPETNRCRNVVGEMTKAEFAPVQENKPESNMIVILSFVGVGCLAVGYGVWEWRSEIFKVAHSLKAKFSK